MNYNYENMSQSNNGLKILFGPNYRDWIYPNMILSSVTPVAVSEIVAKKSTEIFQKKPDEVMHLWDMFGGSGRDTISFNKYYTTITTEINDFLWEHLTMNLLVQQLSSPAYAYHIDSVLADHKQFMPIDIVYLDPPWGETYRRGENFNLNQIQLSNDITVSQLLLNLANTGIPYAIIKTSYRDTTLRKTLENSLIKEITFEKYKLRYLFISLQPLKTLKTP